MTDGDIALDTRSLLRYLACVRRSGLKSSLTLCIRSKADQTQIKDLSKRSSSDVNRCRWNGDNNERLPQVGMTLLQVVSRRC